MKHLKPSTRRNQQQSFSTFYHYPKCSFHKDIHFPFSKTRGTKGYAVYGGSSRAYGQRACYNKTIPCCNSQGAEASVLEGMETEEADPTGYKCRQGVSLDRGRLRRFNHDPSYTDRPHTARIPNRLSSMVLERPGVFDRDTNSLQNSPFFGSTLPTYR